MSIRKVRKAVQAVTRTGSGVGKGTPRGHKKRKRLAQTVKTLRSGRHGRSALRGQVKGMLGK